MKWFVKEGEEIKAFDRLCEVQSDKATVEITSRYDGRVVSVHHEEGSIVPVGSALVDISTRDGTAEEAPAKIANEGEHTPQLSVPHVSIDESIGEGSHTLKDNVPMINNGGHIQATPAVRKIAKENNVDLRALQGTGPKGRILKDDVIQYVAKNGKGASAPATFTFLSVPDANATPVFVKSAEADPASVSPASTYLSEDKVVKIKGVQRLMVKSMQAALSVQHLTLGEEVQLDNLVRVRRELNLQAAKSGLKLSYMPFID